MSSVPQAGPENRTPPEIIEAMKAARAAGFCVVPPEHDGSKKPAGTWKQYQTTKPTDDELNRWYVKERRDGLGYVTGTVSGIECFEFDDAGILEAFQDAAVRTGLGELVARVETGYSDRSPGGGVHWYYRCPDIGGNTKLAERPDQESGTRNPLIETRGEGGYVVAAPSQGGVHPSGKPYVLQSGGPATIATITPEERHDLFTLARSFNETPPRQPADREPTQPSGERVGDIYSAAVTWPDILEPHGWIRVYERDGVTYWRRPGKDRGISATTNHGGHDALYVFTSSTVFEPNTGYRKLTAYVMLNHGGDWTAAIRALADQGYAPDGPMNDGRAADGERRDPAPHHPAILQTRAAADIEPREVEWLWRGWLPLGMIAVLAGYGGGGKSTIALQIAAAVSTGGTLPDGTRAPLGNVLYFAAEDSPEHTLIPRLQAMGADRNRVHIVDGIRQPGDEQGWVQLRTHVAAIEEAVRRLEITLAVIDPVSSFIGDANSDKESDVRAALTPLKGMAERTGSAVLMIRHVSKGGDSARAASRILGSTAWHDLPRIAWMLADAPDDYQPEPHEDGTRDTVRVLGVVKSNLAAKPAAQWFVQPVDEPMRWKPGPSPVTIDECFLPADRATKSEAAEDWVRDSLKGGSKESVRLFAAAKAEGHSEKTVRRALKAIGAEKFQLPGKAHGGWLWRLPNGTPEVSGSLGQVTPGESGGQSDQVTGDGSLGHRGQVSKVTASTEDSTHSPKCSPGPGEAGHLVTWPNSPYTGKWPSDQVTAGEPTPIRSEPLAPTGTDPEVQVF